MPDFMLLMHDDAEDKALAASPSAWNSYLSMLNASGQFRGGSEIGNGASFRKSAPCPPVSAHLTGFIRIHAADLTAAQTFLRGNPVYEAGGTVEIRLLPEDET